MVDVTIFKIKNKKWKALLNFLFSLADEVGFSSFHNYHLDENVFIDILDEYKRKSKEKHHEYIKFYENNDPFFVKAIKKQGVRNREEFYDYMDQIYESDLELCKKMEENANVLFKETNEIDYKLIFKEFAPFYKDLEIHYFDVSRNASLIPIDLIIYENSPKMQEEVLKLATPTSVLLANTEEKIHFINPFFSLDNLCFANINSETGLITMTLKDDEYEAFKKLKIKHVKEPFNEESK